MIPGAGNPNNAGIFHQLEQRVNDLLDPPQLRFCTMCAVTRMAGELIYDKSLLWSANQKSCIGFAQKTMGWNADQAARPCYLTEFLVRPEVSIPLVTGVLLFAFAGRQVWNTLNIMVEFRPENITLLSAGLMLFTVAEALGYQTGY